MPAAGIATQFLYRGGQTEVIEQLYYIILSNEGCDMCNTCTYPDEPCRFPEKLQHSIEGYGILVSQLAEMANVNYNNGENTITYFGALLFNDLDII